jgi:putative glutamine amidotransferase
MRNKPLIGLNADFRSARKDSPAYTFLSAGYHDCIETAGGIPVVVPPINNEEDLQRVLDTLDGFVLVGGGDLDPRLDGFMLHTSVKLMDNRRELFDRKLMRLIAQRRMPVLGIGVGMQLMNVVQGGNLFLHIPEDVPTAIPHKDPLDPAHRHTLTIVQDSLIGRVYGDGEIRVNSMHHMAIDEVARGFRITARCPDGIIEAIESTREDWFAVGTQFHPEAESASAVDIRIFEEFICGITGETLAMPALEEELAAVA